VVECWRFCELSLRDNTCMHPHHQTINNNSSSSSSTVMSRRLVKLAMTAATTMTTTIDVCCEWCVNKSAIKRTTHPMLYKLIVQSKRVLGARRLAAQSTCQQQIGSHQRDAFGVHTAQQCVFKQATICASEIRGRDQRTRHTLPSHVGFSRFLKSSHSVDTNAAINHGALQLLAN
jgi:hypothetical protein